MPLPLNRTIVVAFGRFNPPTKGHAKLFKRMEWEARARKCQALVFPTPTSGDLRNPLPFAEKVDFLQQMFPHVLFFEKDYIRNPFDALWLLCRLRYEHIVIVTGDDRIREYTKLQTTLPKLDIDVVPVWRDSHSARKLRDAATLDNFVAFAKGLPTKNVALAKQIFSRVRYFLTRETSWQRR